MSNDGAESQYGFDDADAWDRAADERERLAEEREQLANEREALANEREHLADEQERLLDQRYERLEANSDLGAAGDDQLTRVEVEGQLARSVARLERAVAEIHTPSGFAAEAYTLREHVGLVRRAVMTRMAPLQVP